MRRFRSLLLTLATLLGTLAAYAQEVNITVTPKQSVLPPQIAQYIYDPSQLFTVTLTNTTTEDLDVYLTVEIEQEVPKSGLNVHINPNYQPNSHLTLIPGSKTLDALEIKNIFMGVPNNQVSVPSGLVEGYTNGSFGLLPEGQYRARFVAYKWAQPKYATPQVCSTPSSGECIFNVCYKAQPPKWQNPFVARAEDIAEFTETTIFSWQVPQGGDCALTGGANYKYQIKMVELTGLNAPDYCLEHNPTVYMPAPTTSTTHVISQNVFLNNLIQEGKTYVAQITATPTSGSAMNYVTMVNGGKSEIRLLRYKKSDKFASLGDLGKDDSDRNLNWSFEMYADDGVARKLEYQKPIIREPYFEDGKVRNINLYSDINLEWRPCDFIAAAGEKMPDNEFKYEVQLFKGNADTAGKLQETLNGTPIYSKKDLTEHELTIPWEDIEEYIKDKDYLVVRVQPTSELDDTINYVGGNTNILDFSMTEKKLRDFFRCSNTVEIDNTWPTTKKAKDFEGTTVGLGEYQLTIESIENDSREKNSFKGRGYVEWELPVGTAHVKVEFDTLKINTQDIVYGGLAHSYGDPAQTTASAAVEKLFSDSGLDDWLVRADVPYAKDITQAGKSAIADNVSDVTTYYEAIQKVEDIYTLLKGGKADIYTPIRLPIKELGFDAVPVDLQVTTMVFSPTWATMDVLGEFKLPDSPSLGSDAILLGSPRLCISPTSLLPEAGTIALMDKFTVKDPKTEFECTFNAPEDPIAPTNGNYIAWKDHKFEVMCIDIDMGIPGTKKCDATGKPTNQLADLHVMTEIGINKDVKRWADLILEAEMEPFEVNQLEGFTFEARDIVLDLSSTSNSSKMAEFPKEYDKTDGIGSNDPRLWEGLYIGDLAISMPEGLVGSGDNRLKLESKEMFFDQSGVTLKAGLFASGPDGLQASAGGFSVGLTEASLNVIQDDFRGCLLKGTLGLPLLKNNDGDKSKIGFTCQIRKQLDDSKKEQDNYAMVFNTESLNGDYNLDLLLANLKLEDELTYFLLEVEKGDNDQTRTRAELMLGGRIEIGGKNAEDKSIGYALHLPDIHFVGMRIANCDPWESNYVDFQYKADEKKKDLVGDALMVISEGKEFVSDDGSFHFDTGAWSLASAKKQLGPFEFSLDDYGLVNESGDNGKVLVGLKVTGTVALVKGLDISATVHDLKILGYIDNIGLDLSNIDVGFEKVSLGGISVNTSFCGMTLEGGVMFYDGNDKETVQKYFEEKKQKDVKAFDVSSFDAVGKGFMAYFRMALPGDFLNISASGGFFNTSEKGEKDFDEDYSWGWIYASIGGSAGIQMPPVVINKIGGGFYWNCRRNEAGYDKLPINQNGLVGFVFDLGLASSDGHAVKGDFQLAVVYNRKRNCLTSFTLTGRLVALGGMVNANASIVYENNDMDKYFQLNITVDASLSAESMAGALAEFGGGLGSIKEQLETLVGKANLKEVVAGAKDGLGSKIGEGSNSPQNDLGEGEMPPENDKQEKEPTSEDKERAEKQGTKAAGASISLDFKITWKKNGENLGTPLWHFYLGEPEESKRCSFVIIDFNIAIVHATIGANAYLCLGNELPNNGALPPIPETIAKFLDGGSHGDGYTSDNISDANAARDKALAGFKTDFGVMLGAQVYGSLGIDLGIIYGDIDMLAGFDVSLVHFDQNAFCTNFGRPGYRGWYGRGQLYAYLAMALGVRFNLGFVDFDIPLVKAAVGGMLKFGGPSPTYFNGKVRAKVELLGGLFKLNKSYSFDVGEECKLFHGNPLDNFMLFNDCVVGDTIRSTGWSDESAAGQNIFVDPKIKTPVFVGTDAAIGEHFRLVDENYKDRYAQSAGIDPDTPEFDKLNMMASRTFIFHTAPHAILFEYDSEDQFKEKDFDKSVKVEVTNDPKDNAMISHHGASHWYEIPIAAGGTTTHHYLDMPRLRSCLKPNKYYRLAFVGNAKELKSGLEVYPYTCEKDGSNCDNRKWTREVSYYFRTSAEKIINDIAPLEDYVAIAYPSNFNELSTSEEDAKKSSRLEYGVQAYLNDVQSPVLALTEDLRQKAFKHGKLYWRLLNPMGQQIDYAENRWVETKDENGQVVGVNMEPSHRLNAAPGKHYILAITYTQFNEKDDKDKKPDDWYNIVDTTLYRLNVETLAQDRNWLTGRSYELGSCDYDQPFIAVKMTSKKFDYKRNIPADGFIAQDPNNYLYDDPFTYIGYHSNFAFPAGWTITEHSFFNFEVLTSESMIYNAPGGTGKYEGVYTDSQPVQSHAKQDWNKLRDMVFYELPAGSENRDQPSTAWPLSTYWQTGVNNKWKYVYHTDPRVYAWRHTGKAEVTKDNLEFMLNPIHDTYDAIERFDHKLKDDRDFSITQFVSMAPAKPYYEATKSDIKNKYVKYRGQYLTEEGFKNSSKTEDTGLGSRTSKLDENGKVVATQSNSKRQSYENYIISVPAYQLPTIFSAARLEEMSGAYAEMSNDCDRANVKELVIENMSRWNGGIDPDKIKYFDAAKAKKHVTSISYAVYRVNAFDFVHGNYMLSTKLLNGSPIRLGYVDNPLTDNSKVSSPVGEYYYNHEEYSNGEEELTVGTLSSVVIDDNNDATVRSNDDNYKTIESLAAEMVHYYEKFMPYYAIGDTIWRMDYPEHLNTLQTLTNSVGKVNTTLIKGYCNNGDLTWDEYLEGTHLTGKKMDVEDAMNAIKNDYAKMNNAHRDYSYEADNRVWNKLKLYGDEKSKEYKRYKSMRDMLVSGGHEMTMWRDSLERSYDDGFYPSDPHGEARAAYNKYQDFLYVQQNAQSIAQQILNLTEQIKNKFMDMSQQSIYLGNYYDDNEDKFKKQADLFKKIQKDMEGIEDKVLTQSQLDELRIGVRDCRIYTREINTNDGYFDEDLSQLADYLTDIQGSDGKGGLLGQLDALFAQYGMSTDGFNCYKDAKGWVKSAGERLKSWQKKEPDMKAFKEKCVSTDVLDEYDELLDLEQDEINGCDRKAAMVWYAKIDSLANVLTEAVKDFDVDALDEAENGLIDQYVECVNDRYNYMRGNISAIDQALDDCLEWWRKLVAYRNPIVELHNLPVSLIIELDSAIVDAGYDVNHKLTVEARTKLDRLMTEDRAKVTTIYARAQRFYNLWGTEFSPELLPRLERAVGNDAVWSWHHLVGLIQQEAEHTKENPDRVLAAYYNPLVYSVMEELNEMYRIAQQSDFENRNDKLKSDYNTLHRGMSDKMVEGYWYDYQEAKFDLQDHDFGYYRELLQKCIDECQKYEHNLDSVKNLSGSASSLREQVGDSISKADRLFNQIPDEWWYKDRDTRIQRDQTSTSHYNVTHYYHGIHNDTYQLMLAYGKEKPLYDSIVKPIYEDAKAAMDYLVANRRPYYSPEDLEELEERREQAEIDELYEKFDDLFELAPGWEVEYNPQYPYFDRNEMKQGLQRMTLEMSSTKSSMDRAWTSYGRATTNDEKLRQLLICKQFATELHQLVFDAQELCEQVENAYKVILQDKETADETRSRARATGHWDKSREDMYDQIYRSLGNMSELVPISNTTKYEAQQDLRAVSTKMVDCEREINTLKTALYNEMKVQADTLRARSDRAYSAALKPLNTINSVYSNLNAYHTYAQNQYNTMNGTTAAQMNRMTVSTIRSKASTLRTYISKFETYSTDYFGKWQTLNSEISKLQEYQRGLEELLAKAETFFGKNSTQYNYVKGRVTIATSNCNTMVRSRDTNVTPKYENAKNWPSEVTNWKSKAEYWEKYMPLIVN